MSTILFTFSSANLMLQLISGIPNTAAMGRKVMEVFGLQAVVQVFFIAVP